LLDVALVVSDDRGEVFKLLGCFGGPYVELGSARNLKTSKK